jgi:hypothetical protein
MDIIASGPHNSNKVKLNLLNGLQPGLSPAMAASLRGCPSCRRGLGSSVPPEGEGSILGLLGLLAIFGGVGYLALKVDEKKRRSRRK